MSELHKHAAVFEAAMRGEADEWEVNSSGWDGYVWKTAGEYLDSIYNEPKSWNSRRKQKTHVVNGFTVPEPLREPLNKSDHFFVEDADGECFNFESFWNDDGYQKMRISRGIAHATKEGAIANCKARLGIDPYKDES